MILFDRRSQIPGGPDWFARRGKDADTKLFIQLEMQRLKSAKKKSSAFGGD